MAAAAPRPAAILTPGLALLDSAIGGAETVGVLAPLAAGAAIVLPAGITGPQIAAALKDGRCTIMIAVPRLYYEAMLEGIANRWVASRARRDRACGTSLVCSGACGNGPSARAGVDGRCGRSRPMGF
jgi:hypothetical protein